LHFVRRCQGIERALHIALADAKRQCECGARPGFAIGKESQHGGMGFLDRSRQDDDPLVMSCLQFETTCRGADIGERFEQAAQPADGEALLIQERGRTERVPLAEVLYLRAEQKYVTVRTATRSFVVDDALSELEARHTAHFLRVHRSTLVARRAMRALERHYDADEGEGWAVRLHGLTEPLPVSRRQVAAVREALAG